MTEYKSTVADKELINAIKQHDVTGVEDLLRLKYQSININHVDANTRLTPLILAITCTDFNLRRCPFIIVLTLLDYGADPNILSCPRSGLTALHYACKCQNSHVVEILLKFNAHMNCQDEIGMTPLHLLVWKYMTIAVSADHGEILRCIRLLHNNHANFNIYNKREMTCVFYSIGYVLPRKLDVLQLLLSYNDVDINLPLLRQEPFEPYIIGDTILHCSVRKYNIEIVNMILKALIRTCSTSNLLIRNNDNETAYDVAKRLRHQPIMECLERTSLFQCHIFLRQNWIQVMNNPDDVNKANDVPAIMVSSRKRKKK